MFIRAAFTEDDLKAILCEELNRYFNAPIHPDSVISFEFETDEDGIPLAVALEFERSPDGEPLSIPESLPDEPQNP